MVAVVHVHISAAGEVQVSELEVDYFKIDHLRAAIGWTSDIGEMDRVMRPHSHAIVFEIAQERAWTWVKHVFVRK